MTFHTITYTSAARTLLSPRDLGALLRTSRANNARFGITGLLLYKSGSFMQAIEGPKSAVVQLYRNICQDPLHYNVIKIVEETASERAFPGWHMGFKCHDKDIAALEGYTDFFHAAPDRDFFIPPSNAKELLRSFRQQIR